MTTTALTPTPTNEARSIAEASRDLLDRTYEQIRRGQVQAGIHELVLGLRVMRDIYPTAPWQSFSQNDCLLHAIRDVVHQDPFTRRSFDKPRGYPGDAGILDLIYGAVPLPEGTTEMGTEVYAYTVQAPACESVRARRDLIAETIDEIADVVDKPRILSVACGHLREAGKSRAVREGRIGEYLALDHDSDSLALVERDYGELGVRTINNSVRGLVTGKVQLTSLDFAYASGLYDYLGLPVATAVTKTMLEMLRPGGRLLVANFAPNLRDIGYMESYMAWSLIYRDERDMATIASGLPQERVARQRLFRDPHDNIVYLEVTRA
jgi:extracellular factor (EF) 3-hydroxypalmitic acid methyl ester biosynthesis protein